MSLSTVGPQLPADIETPEAERFAAFLRHHDGKLEESVDLTLYGSAAVAFYLADDVAYSYGYSTNVDIGRMEPAEVKLSVDSEVVEPALEF